MQSGLDQALDILELILIWKFCLASGRFFKTKEGQDVVLWI